ncbi:hypothetical protein ACQPW3_11445 [Actinosynnema sp. CA-248983]
MPVLVHNCPAKAKSKKAPEFESGELKESQTMGAAEKWRGKGYEDKGNGRYVSADGERVVRYGSHETRSKTHHTHVEAMKDGHVIENTMVRIVR